METKESIELTNEEINNIVNKTIGFEIAKPDLVEADIYYSDIIYLIKKSIDITLRIINKRAV
jgi:hypothetical protein